VAALCAVACVARAWRDAALHPALWRDFSTCLGDAAARLTDTRLAALVARAHGGLERLHLSGCTALTAFGVAAALRGHPPLAELRVRGVLLGAADDADTDDALEAACEALRAAVRDPLAGLDVHKHIRCCDYAADGVEGAAWCSRLCRGPTYAATDEEEDASSEGDACPGCEDYCECCFCPACAARATAAGVSPCQRVCGGCGSAHHRNKEYGVRDCRRCAADICDECQPERFCDGKCFYGGPLCAACTDKTLRTCSACARNCCGDGDSDDNCHMGSDASRCPGCDALLCGGCCEDGVQQAMRLEGVRTRGGVDAAAAAALDASATHFVPCDMARVCNTIFCAACAPAGLPSVAADAVAVLLGPGVTPRPTMRLCAACVCGDTVRKDEARRLWFAEERARREAGEAGPSGVVA
jgi:hypothetical protein